MDTNFHFMGGRNGESWNQIIVVMIVNKKKYLKNKKTIFKSKFLTQHFKVSFKHRTFTIPVIQIKKLHIIFATFSFHNFQSNFLRINHQFYVWFMLSYPDSQNAVYYQQIPLFNENPPNIDSHMHTIIVVRFTFYVIIPNYIEAKTHDKIMFIKFIAISLLKWLTWNLTLVYMENAINSNRILLKSRTGKLHEHTSFGYIKICDWCFWRKRGEKNE